MQKIDSQAKLVRAAQAGDLDSFGTLCESYYAPLVAVAYSVLGDHQLAEDAAQEAFARGLTNLRKLKDSEKFAPWLAQICRHVAADMARVRRRSASVEERAERTNDRQDDEPIRQVRIAIDRLPTSMKEVVVLRYYNHCSYEQMSAVLGLSRTTINGRLTRAKRKLAKMLRQHDGMER
ncbi:MAG: sigma-70 family RNA polymerase sigma factor [Sedimentisphaerales bacterium]|nr:sigma-70 family RNA polymerase sigma factor [Sedimentisphaerales bacterium]